MRLLDRYTHLHDLFDMSAKDFAVLFNEFGQLPPSELQAAIGGD